jgi:hypothetical protein
VAVRQAARGQQQQLDGNRLHGRSASRRLARRLLLLLQAAVTTARQTAAAVRVRKTSRRISRCRHAVRVENQQ